MGDVTKFEREHPGSDITGAQDVGAPTIINHFGDVRTEKTLDLAITEPGQ